MAAPLESQRPRLGRQPCELLLDSVTGLLVDVTLSIDVDREAEIVDVPVETGADVSDHRRVKPRTLRLSGIITDAPADPVTLDEEQQRALTRRLIANVEQGTITTVEGESERSKEGYRLLNEAYERRTLLALVTELETHQDLAIQSLNIHKDQRTGLAISFSLTLRELFFATTQIGIVATPRTNTRSAKPTKDAGAKAPAKATPQVKSLAVEWFF